MQVSIRFQGLFTFQCRRLVQIVPPRLRIVDTYRNTHARTLLSCGSHGCHPGGHGDPGEDCQEKKAEYFHIPCFQMHTSEIAIPQ